MKTNVNDRIKHFSALMAAYFGALIGALLFVGCSLYENNLAALVASCFMAIWALLNALSSRNRVGILEAKTKVNSASVSNSHVDSAGDDE